MNLESMMSYPFGTLVWVKVVNRYWWPGTVVDPQTIPEDLLEYVNKLNHIAVVHFEHENKYEVVIKHDKICLYSGPYKLEYIEKGLNLYINQMKGIPTLGKFDMATFKKDILSMEKRIGGDVNIFENIKKNQQQIKLLINSYFTPSKTKNRKREKVVKESVKVVRKSQGKSLPAKKFLSTSKTKESPSIPQPKQNCASKQKSSPPSKVVKLHTPNRTTVTNGYTCHVHVNCTFTTNRYDILKRHMAMCKNDLQVVTVQKSPNAKKRKNIKNKSSEAKKIKLQEELLKDWDNDGEDDDVQFDISNVQSSSGVAPTIAKVELKTSEVLPTTTSEVLPTTTSKDLPNPTSEVLPTTTSEVLPTISNEIQKTNTNSHNTTFDFNKNDDNTTVVEQRQSKSDCSSTVNVINDKCELQLSSDIKSINFETAQNESLIVEKIEDPSNGPREIHSNEIDDQTKTTELLLEKTVNTLDQINNFESSLSDISNTLNKSDSNILTKDNNISGISESNGFDSLKKPTSPSKEVHTEIANSIDIVENVETMSIQTENHEIVEEKTNDTEIVPNDVEVNQPNDITIDKDMPIENSCSVDNISNKMDSEDEITAEKNDVEGLLNVEESNRKSPANNELKEANQWINIDKKQKYSPNLDRFQPSFIDSSSDPVFISEEIIDPRAPVVIDVQKVLLPYVSTKPTKEFSASMKTLQAAVMNGAVLEIVINHPGDIISLPK